MCPILAREQQIQATLNEIEEALANGQEGYAEELNYQLNEMCNEMEQEEDML